MQRGMTKMKRPQTTTERAFTLVELLTVVAVAAVLLSILVPTAAKVKETTRRTMCADNMRQLMAAVLIYARDNANKGPMRGYFTYTVAEPPREALGWSGACSPDLDLHGTLGTNGKLLVNLGPLYRKWIGGRHDMLYCPSASQLRDATWTYGGGSGNGGGWKSAFVPRSECYWTWGGYNYGVPLARKGDPSGPGKSPIFLDHSPFPPSVWSAGFTAWVDDWESLHPGMTFQMPSAPALATDLWVGGFTLPHGNKVVNVMYTDGHVRNHSVGVTGSSGGVTQYDAWYQVSLKQ